MARCEECLHYGVCCIQGKLVKTDEHNWYELGELDNVQDFCKHFIADVVPRSEVERFAEEIKLEFYREFDEIIPSIMADKIDELK